jgi:hypothetical protein
VKKRMTIAYKLLLLLYPPEYRAEFAEEMLATFAESAQERRERGYVVFARFVMEEINGVLSGAAKQWIEKITSIARTRNKVPYFDSSAAADAARILLQNMRTPWVSRETFFKITDLICDSGLSASASQTSLPHSVVEAQERIRFLIGRMINAISKREFERVRFYSNEERCEREKLRLLLDELQNV